jgi:lysyl-tRNA synthetase, class II
VDGFDREDPGREPALDRHPVLLARSHAAAPSGSRLPDGTGRGWVAASARCADAALIRVEQHPLGPRVYVLGQRVHEVALGLGILGVLAILLGIGVLSAESKPVLVILAAGTWLALKDWRDLFPRWRNQQVHCRFAPHLAGGRGRSRLPGLPAVAAAGTVAVAAVNAASALTPNVAWRGHLLLRVEPVAALPVFHAVAVPASLALGLTGVSLYHRRRRALWLAIALLVVLGVVDELKGLDFEEAALSAGLALALWYGRRSFDVEHEPFRARAAAAPLAGAMLAIAVAGAIGVWVAGGTDPSVRFAVREAGGLLLWRPLPAPFDDPGAPFAVRALVVLTLVVTAWTLFRPRRPPTLTTAEERRRALGLVRAHGRDTLSAFKLRTDLEYLFSPAGDAFAGYRVSNGVLLVAGDPVGPDDSVTQLLSEVRSFARVHGLRLGVVGASEDGARSWRQLGLRALYIGDEAVVGTSDFSLEGRSIRKVRQSISRLGAAGYTAGLVDVATLRARALAELEVASTTWLGEQPERGFAMATTLSDPAAREGVVALAWDAAGSVRGLVLYLPTFGRAAMSLALMRRDRDTPNGLMEFLVARSLVELRERGVEEVSLNFAAFARPLRSPRGSVDRVMRRLLGVAGRWYQIESLYRFNAKFFPRWEPRYLVFESPAALPRVGFATLIAEGQVPRSLAALCRVGPTA